MNDLHRQFHEEWLGLVQPVEGLVVSLPALVDAQCMNRNHVSVQHKLQELAPEEPQPDKSTSEDVRRRRVIADLDTFFAELLDLRPDDFHRGDQLPRDLYLNVAEGGEPLVPTLALLKRGRPEDEPAPPDGATPAILAGAAYVALVMDLAPGVDLDKPEGETNTWHYPPAARFDRLLRACGVPIGLLTNRRAVRLIYAPAGATSGSITFRVDDMAATGGRLILDAFVMLLHANRFFGVTRDQTLPAILADSRTRQAEITNDLAEQVFYAVRTLLDAFAAAAARDDTRALADAMERGEDHVYGGLLTVLMRLVFLLYAEEHGLMPSESDFYAEHLSVIGLFEQLQDDAGAYPDTMERRFGAWPRLLALFRGVFLGMDHPEFSTPARRGHLFDPEPYPFLEGWSGVGGAPITMLEDRAAVRTPSVDDRAIFRILQSLLVLNGQRLSYRALDVEQIGSVYERLMGYHVLRLPAPAACVGKSRVWITVDDVKAQPRAQRAKWLKQEADLSTALASKLADAIHDAPHDDAILAALAAAAVKRTTTARAGQLVLQPGEERRRTSSHYTPRTLSSRIVQRTLEPLLAAMGDAPTAARILDLKVCDPAMGSGAFLVEACRFLADQLVAAWTREAIADASAGEPGPLPGEPDPLAHARRLIAQRCLYGVDKNPFAVHLAKLSLWLITLARDEPFTFVDHALRHGDSLVGLSLDQLRGFHWDPSPQLHTHCRTEIDDALRDALRLRQELLAHAKDGGAHTTADKEWLLSNADEAMAKARLIGDLVVGAFFAHDKPKVRLAELSRRRARIEEWLPTNTPPPEDLLQLQHALREHLPVFHWMLELPEVFQDQRADPLDHDHVNHAAFMDAFVGNPPFAGKNNITATGGPHYLEWLQTLHTGAHGNADLSAHFFLRAADLLGDHGAIGLIATNTIAQGDTRDTALKPLIHRGFTLYDATENLPWPGEAAVIVSVVHLTLGSPALVVANDLRLNGAPVAAISSRLRPKPERPDPTRLKANEGLSFVGSYVLGMGFTLTPEERDALVTKDPRNAERIFPYLGGQEVNSSPTHDFDRYVINFGQMELEEAEAWPDLMAIVHEKVKPERDKNKRDVRKKYWWRFGEVAPALYKSVSGLERCLVTARISKHLSLSFQPTTRVWSDMLYVFPLDRHAHFALLQSRTHEAWARLLSSSMKTDLRYAASDCFETFPFPPAPTLAPGSPLDVAGERLYTARARYMVETDQGLTTTYNQLKDVTAEGPGLAELRELHEAMDRAVLEAYGWGDVEVPPFTTPEEGDTAGEAAVKAFEDEVIDRVFVLNEELAGAERLKGTKTLGKKGR